MNFKGVGKSSITLEKTVSELTAAQYLPGTEVTYDFKITNSGATTLTSITLTDDGFSGSGELGDITCDDDANLSPGSSRNCQATYTLTQADVNAEKLTNSARANATTLDGAVEVKDTSEVDINFESEIPTVIQINNKAVTRDGSKLVENDEVTFDLTITNNGATTLSNVSVTSVVTPGANAGTDDATASSDNASNAKSAPMLVATGTEVKPTCDSISTDFGPGDSFECTVTTKISLADLEAGGVTNAATAKGTRETGNTVSATASVDVAGLKVPPAPATKPPAKLVNTGADLSALWAAVAVLALGVGVPRVNRRHNRS